MTEQKFKMVKKEAEKAMADAFKEVMKKYRIRHGKHENTVYCEYDAEIYEVDLTLSVEPLYT